MKQIIVTCALYEFTHIPVIYITYIHCMTNVGNWKTLRTGCNFFQLQKYKLCKGITNKAHYR